MLRHQRDAIETPKRHHTDTVAGTDAWPRNHHREEYLLAIATTCYYDQTGGGVLRHQRDAIETPKGHHRCTVAGTDAWPHNHHREAYLLATAEKHMCSEAGAYKLPQSRQFSNHKWRAARLVAIVA